MAWHRINQLLLNLYACPTEPGRWPAVLDQMCDAMRARSAVVQLLVQDGLHVRSRWMVRDSRSEADREIHDRYFSDTVNPRMLMQRARSWPEQVIVRDRDIFEPDDPLYLDLQRRLSAAQLDHFMSVRLPISEYEGLALVLHRAFGERQDFNRAEERFALECMPHLLQTVQLATTLHRTAEHTCDLREAVNSVRAALVLCHADATVRWMNRAAESILVQRDALWLSNDRLTAASTRETSLLRQAIRRAAQEPIESEAEQLLVLGGGCARQVLQAKVQRIDAPPASCNAPGLAQPRRRVLLMLSDPNQAPALPAHLLRRLFALSPAESRLAAALCSGSTLNGYAHEYGVSVGTARYQLKQIMAKTRVSRQSQLIQRLYSSVVAQALT